MRVKNFLKPDKHLHKDPQVRLECIRELDPDDGESQALLIGLALDDDLAVRIAAIGKVSDVAVLQQLLDANGDDAAEVRSATEQRIAGWLESGAASDPAVEQLLGSHADRLAVTIAVHSATDAQRQLALARIGEETSYLQVVQQSRFHDTRMAAAEHLSQHDVLRAALSACRSRDKVVVKLLQQKLDAQAAAEADLIAARHAVSTTLASMQSLAKSVWAPQHSGRQQSLQLRWDSLDMALKRESADAFQLANDQVSALITEHATATAATTATAPDETAAGVAAGQSATSVTVAAATEAATTAPDTPSATSVAAETAGATGSVAFINDDVQLRSVQDALQNPSIESLAAALEPFPRDSLSKAASMLIAHAQAAAVLFDPPLDIAKARPGVLQQRIKRVATLVDTNETLPGIDTTDLAYIAGLSVHREELLQRLDKAKQESTDRIKATHRQFSALVSTISDGKWGPAKSMLRRLQKKITAMETAERTTLGDKLARAEKQLADMSDWQDFAARPKLEALCEQMEALPSKELKTEAVAREVKNFQAQWKALGVSRASNELWSRFKTAGDTAYEPCKAFFEEKQVERQAKMDAKKQLCDALEIKQAELDSAEAEWKVIQRTVNDAKREWSRNRIPDRKPDKQLEAKFSAILKPFEEKLAGQYDANAVLKKELVEKVQKLAEAEINQHSVNQTRSLQSAWKQIGIMRRREDQTLWESFNGHCRTIFKQQHASEREHYKASMGHVFRARDIIKSLKQIAKQGSPEDQQVQALATEFQDLAEFPEKDKKFLLRDFRGAIDACSRVQQTQSRRREQAGHEELMRCVALCEQLEAAVETPDLRSDTLRDDVLHAWESSDVKMNREHEERLEQRRSAALAHLDGGTRFDYDSAENVRRDLLIRMEVAAGLDTPGEDKARRMQYQLAHLQEGMTSAGVADAQTSLAALELDWLSAAPVLRSLHDALQSRYLKAVGR